MFWYLYSCTLFSSTRNKKLISPTSDLVEPSLSTCGGDGVGGGVGRDGTEQVMSELPLVYGVIYGSVIWNLEYCDLYFY
jgi:hypothetical protein